MVAKTTLSRFDKGLLAVVENRMMWRDPILATQMQEVVKNATLMSQQALMRMGGMGQDPRRSIDDECGYPDIITPQDYRDLFDREPIPNRVVKVLPLECFQANPEVYEDEDVGRVTPFEQAWHDLPKNLRGESYYQDEDGNPIWEMIQRLDIVSRIGSFGLMLMGIDDGRRLDQPIDGFEDSVSAGGSFYPAYGTDAQYGAIPLTPRKNTPTTQNTEENGKKEEEVIHNWRIIAYESPDSDVVINRDIQAKNRREALDLFYRDNPTLSPFQLLLYNAAPPPFEQDAPNLERPDFMKKRTGFKDPIGDPQTQLDQPRSMDLPNQTQALYPIPVRDIDEQPGGRTPNIGDGRDDERFVGGDERYINDQGQMDPSVEFAGQAPTDTERMGERTYGQPGGQPNFNDPNDPENYDVDGNFISGDSEGDPNDPTNYDVGEPGVDDQIKPVTTKHKLNFLRCYDETLIWVIQYESDPTSIRYGFPVYYNVILNDPRTLHGGIGLTQTIAKVHWSRVIHAADNLVNSEVFGEPAQKPVYNRLLDIKKLHGGSAEMYWKGAFPGFFLGSHPQLGGDVAFDMDDIRNQFEQYFNGLQRYLGVAGAQMNPLAPQVVDPTQQIQTQIDAICIQMAIPKRVFMGSERGELASSQDDQTWNDRIRQRRNSYLTPRIIVPFVDRLIKIGVLPIPSGFSVVWPDLNAMSDIEKAQKASTIAAAMASFVSGELEEIMDIQDFYVRVIGFDEEEAMEIIERVMMRGEQQMLTQDPAQEQELHDAQVEQMTNPDLVPDNIQTGDQHHYEAGYGDREAELQHERLMDQQDQMGGPPGQMPGQEGAMGQDQGPEQIDPAEAAQQSQPMDGVQPMADQIKGVQQKGIGQKPKGATGKRPKAIARNAKVENILQNVDRITEIQQLGKELRKSGLIMPGYGQIFLKDNQIWFVGGDGDEREAMALVKSTLSEVPGVTEVNYTDERFPPKGQGWQQVFPKLDKRRR